MKPYVDRPIEIRNLFNPAFCAATLASSICGYSEVSSKGIPFSLSFLVLPLCLNSTSREIIRRTNRSYLLKIVSENPVLLIDLPTRCITMRDFTLEALGFLSHIGILAVSKDGCMGLVGNSFPNQPNGTIETKNIYKTARTFGKAMAEVGDQATIYFSLGIRP